jgi:hypothetical protein
MAKSSPPSQKSRRFQGNYEKGETQYRVHQYSGMKAVTEFIDTRYVTLLDVVLTHAYYDQGYCPHIVLEPTAECQAFLRHHRLQWKQKPLGGAIVGSDPAIIPLPTEPVPLSWHICLRNMEFLTVTQLVAGQSMAGKVYALSYQGGSWSPMTASTVEGPVTAGAIALVRVSIPLETSTSRKVEYAFQTPEVQWQYYIVTDANYTETLRIFSNGTAVSTPVNGETAELPMVRNRYPQKRIVVLSTTLQLQKNFPAWYLVAGDNGAPAIPVADIPALPKPRPGAPPHVILDYSAILK